MCDFFEECELDFEPISEKRVNKIKSSVLSRIKEEPKMKKSTVLRSIMLAAAVAAVGTLPLIGSADSVPTASSENDTAVTDTASAPEDNANDIVEDGGDITIEYSKVFTVEELAELLPRVVKLKFNDDGYVRRLTQEELDNMYIFVLEPLTETEINDLSV